MAWFLYPLNTFCTKACRASGEMERSSPGKGLAQVNVRQVLHPAQAVGQSVQIKLEIGCVYERGEVERPAAQVKSTIQIKVQGAGINGERVFEGVGIHREDRGKIQRIDQTLGIAVRVPPVSTLVVGSAICC